MRIEVKRNILAGNASLARENRARLASREICMINLMASPGAGKTSAIKQAISLNSPALRMAVIEGDIASEIDSLAIEALNVTALQINTGGACHLTAAMISTALDHLDLDSLDLVIIENVGNLVCPAEFDLGESARVVIASVAEGDDKPHKYPLVFQKADAVLVNKIDLLPYCDFNVDEFRQTVSRLNPEAAIMELSCKNGSGSGQWSRWLEKAATAAATSHRVANPQG